MQVILNVWLTDKTLIKQLYFQDATHNMFYEIYMVAGDFHSEASIVSSVSASSADSAI